MFKTIRLEPFQKELKKILKKFPKAKKRIEGEINSLSENAGNRYPDFGDSLEVRKIRFGLPEYKIGKSNGLRIVCLFLIMDKKRIPLVVYHKKSIGKEQEVNKMIKQRLKEVLSTL